MKTFNLIFTLSVLFGLRVQSVCAYDPAEVAYYANDHCGALNCTSSIYPPYDDDWYRCYQLSLSDSGQSHCKLQYNQTRPAA